MLDRETVQRRIDSLNRQGDALCAAIQDRAPGQPARNRLAARLAEVRAQLTALEWVIGTYTYPQSHSEAATARLIREEYDHA